VPPKSIHCPEEFRNNPTLYCKWSIMQHQPEVIFGKGSKDIIDTELHGYNFEAPVKHPTWMGISNLYTSGYKYGYWFKNGIYVKEVVNIIIKKGWTEKGFDPTAVNHSMGILKTMGLFYREGDTDLHVYYFEDLILEKCEGNLDWFLKGNELIINPPKFWGFDKLIKEQKK
jgi:hypothetical protein